MSGNAWATMLLGAIDNRSTDSSIPIQKPRVNYYGLFVQDDFKLSQRLTLNLGLRYEYYTPMRDADLRLSRYLDLTNPIPEFQGANTPVLPAEVTALRTAAPIYNGAWIFTDSGTPGTWNAQKFLLMPRVGVAWRIDNRTALRAGWAHAYRWAEYSGQRAAAGIRRQHSGHRADRRCTASETVRSIPGWPGQRRGQDTWPIYESRRDGHLV